MSEPKEVRRWRILSYMRGTENVQTISGPLTEVIEVVEATVYQYAVDQWDYFVEETMKSRAALTEAEREIAELRKKLASIMPTIVGNIKFTQATAGTWEKPGEAEREIAILRDKQTQHESTLLETMRVRDEAEREIAELKREALGALSKREIEFEQDNAKLRAQVEFAITEMKRLHHSNFTSLLAATAWMGIPERKREAFIEEHISNSKFILDRALEQLKGGPDGKV